MSVDMLFLDERVTSTNQIFAYYLFFRMFQFGGLQLIFSKETVDAYPRNHECNPKPHVPTISQ